LYLSSLLREELGVSRKCKVYTHPPTPSLKREGEKAEGISIYRPLPSRRKGRKQKVNLSSGPFPQERRGESKR